MPKGIKPDWLKPYQFKAGQSGNPRGKPKLMPEVDGLPRLTKDTYNRLLNQTLHYSKEKLNEVIMDDTSTMLEKWVAMIVSKGTVGGDPNRLEALLSRAIGPIKQEIQHEGDFLVSHQPSELIQFALSMSEKARAIDVGSTARISETTSGTSSEGS
jgi:hypothetical protein